MNPIISDLFFNQQRSDESIELDEDGIFAGYVEEVLTTEADTFTNGLLELGCIGVPSSAQLVQDFLQRV